MKIYLLGLLTLAVALSGCKEDKLGVYPVPDKGPSISALTVQGNASELSVPGELSYDIKISDQYTLSTLDVSVEMGETVVASQREMLYTHGNSYTGTGAVAVPFLKDMAEGTPVTVKFTATNVPGGETLESTTLNLKRPVLDKIYIFLNGGLDGIEMTKDAENGNLFRYATGDVMPSTFTAKFADAPVQEDATFVWVADPADKSMGIVGDYANEGVSGNFATTIVEAITFDVLSFAVGAEGEESDYTINGVPMAPAAGQAGGLLYAKVNFTQGSTVPVVGVEDLEAAYNRDFFSYFNGTITFLRDSGEWDVYYSTEYNYFWIRKNGAVAPEAYYATGDGAFAPPTRYEISANWSLGGDVIYEEYFVKTAENKYQSTMYLRENTQWGFNFEIYGDLGWGGKVEFSSTDELSGDTTGFGIAAGGFVQAEGFEPGYYRFELDLTGAAPAMKITRLDGDGGGGEEPSNDPDYTLDVSTWTHNEDGGYYETSYTFEPGKTYRFTGADLDMAKAYNRDFFTLDAANNRATFNCAQKAWTVRYYPEYEYLFLFVETDAYPTAIWPTGQCIVATPTWQDGLYDPWGGGVVNRQYVPMVAANVYSMTVYCGEQSDDSAFMIEFYTTAGGWDEDTLELAEDSLRGDAAGGFVVARPGEASNGIESSANYKAGYYNFLIDLSDATKTIVTVTAAN